MNHSLKTFVLRWLPLVLAVLIVAVAAVLLFRPGENGLAMEANATVGGMPGVDSAARLAQLQGQLDESRIGFSINTSPVFSTGTAEGDLLFENPANNAKLIQMRLVLDATGETLYESGALRPGTYLSHACLKRSMPRGTYPATAYFLAYREDTQEYIGQTGAAVTITVLA